MPSDRIASPAEEVANAITHGIGLILSLIGLPILVIGAAANGERMDVIGASVFGATLVVLYAASTLYHATPHPVLKQRFRILDHAAIYLLIAGTYTPFTLGVLRGAWGWTLFGIVWTLAILGVLFKLAFGPRWQRLSTAMYVGMGWLIIVAVKPMLESVPSRGLVLLLAGGVLYTGGCVFYLARKGWSHPTWHVCVMGGSACHYFAVLGYSWR
jgi:hemolysin III